MTSRLCFGSETSVMVGMMMSYPVLAPRNAGVFPGECETPQRFPPEERGPHNLIRRRAEKNEL
jgi:hypothetical protein